MTIICHTNFFKAQIINPHFFILFIEKKCKTATLKIVTLHINDPQQKLNGISMHHNLYPCYD